MPWLLLFRIILSSFAEDAEVASIINQVQKDNEILKTVLKNPSSLLNKALRNRILGNGELQKSFGKFQLGLQKIINIPKIKKQINTHIYQNNISKLNLLQQKYFENIKNNQDEKILNNNQELNNEDIIGIQVSLSSSALLSGIFIPIIQQQSGNYGILSLTYISNAAKSYDYPMVSLSTWKDMCNTKGGFGTGANSIFLNQYLHGGRTKQQSFKETRLRSKQLEKKSNYGTKSVIGVINKSSATSFARKYGNYGKVSK